MKIKVLNSTGNRLKDMVLNLEKVNKYLWKCIDKNILIQDPHRQLEKIQEFRMTSEDLPQEVDLFEELDHGRTYIKEIKVLETISAKK